MGRQLRAQSLTLIFLCVALVTLWTHASRADADTSRAASARALFEQGVGHTDREEWREATDAFRRALALRDSPVIRYNLASSLAELGKLVEATELLHAVESDARSDAALKQNANALRSELGPRIAHLHIQPPPRVQNLSVTLDGSLLDAAQLDVPLAVDPGRHVVEGRLGELALEASVVELSDGATQRVTLQAPALPNVEPPPAAVALAPAPTPAETAKTLALSTRDRAPLQEHAPDTKRRKRLWWGLSGAALGAAAAVALGVLLAPHKTSTTSHQSGDFDPPSIGVNVPP